MTLRAVFSWLLVGAASACSTPCSMLAERLCACDLAQEQNRRACETARDRTQRARAENVARQTGVEPQRICREALRFFRCPSSERP